MNAFLCLGSYFRAEDTMPAIATTANDTLIDRFFDDVLNGQNLASAAQLLTQDFLVHHPLLRGGKGHMPEVTELMSKFHGAFGQLHYIVDDRVIQEDKVAVRWTATGVHLGEFFGVAPTGIAVTVTGNDVFRVVDGRFAESWVGSDLLGLFHQIGHFPSVSDLPA